MASHSALNNAMRLAPEVLAAGRVEWQLFVTLTWSGQVPRPARRERAARLYLRRLAREARVPFDKLVWIWREEAGEATGRLHYHVLIAGFPPSLLTFDFGVYCGQAWESGWCEARLWKPGLGAAAYSLESGANIYESKRFRANLPITACRNLSVASWRDGRVTHESRSDCLSLAVAPVTQAEDVEHSDKPRVVPVRRELLTGSDQQQTEKLSTKTSEFQVQPASLQSFADKRSEYLAAVNVSRTDVEYYYQAAITGAL